MTAGIAARGNCYPCRRKINFANMINRLYLAASLLLDTIIFFMFKSMVSFPDLKFSNRLQASS